MSSKTPEGKIKEQVKALLKKHNVWYYMPVSLGMGKHGVPDFVCCANSEVESGLFFTIETKAPGKKPTALQEKCMAEIRQAGGMTFIVDGEESLKKVEEWLNGI